MFHVEHFVELYKYYEKRGVVSPLNLMNDEYY